MPSWQILIPTIEHRHEKLRTLLDALAPQIVPGVGVLVYRDNLEDCLGTKRQRLLEASTADYVSFLDDDDEIVPNHVALICEALKERPDYVGWRLRVSFDGVEGKQAFHSLRYPAWSEDAHGYYRHITHKNQIRRDLALLARYDTAVPWRGDEDYHYCAALHETGAVKSEVFIDEVVETYRVNTKDGGATGREPLTEHQPLLEYDFVRYISP